MAISQGAAAAREVVKDFEPRLKAIDPRMRVVFVDQPDDDGALRVGFWHLLRRNEDGSYAWFEISTPDGKYMEPNDQVLDALRRADGWAPRNRGDAFRRGQEARLRAIERKREAEREELRERVKEQADFDFRVQVPVTPDGRGRLRGRKGR
jgi:hypothetical protein